MGIVLKSLALGYVALTGKSMIQKPKGSDETTRNTDLEARDEVQGSANPILQTRAEMFNEAVRIGILVMIIISLLVRGGVG